MNTVRPPSPVRHRRAAALVAIAVLVLFLAGLVLQQSLRGLAAEPASVPSAYQASAPGTAETDAASPAAGPVLPEPGGGITAEDGLVAAGQVVGAYGLCQIYANEPWHFELRPEAPASGCPRMYADPAARER